MMGFGFIGMILFWGILIFLVVWLVRNISQSDRSSGEKTADRDPSARQILEQRYAKGEIDREQYQHMSKDIT